MPEYDEYDKKIQLSEGMDHVRESEPEQKKPVEGYEPNPQDTKYYEVMGIKNSFDNVSVGADKYGQMLITANQMKEPGAATLTSDRKKLKGPRRKKGFEAFGDFYLNPYSGRKGAFGFRADRNLSEVRIFNEFSRAAHKRVDRDQRQTAPFLNLEDDKADLAEARSMSGNSPGEQEEIQRLEKRVQKETESKDRFLHRLRKARKKTYDKEEREQHDELEKFVRTLTGEDGNDTDIGDDDDELRGGGGLFGERDGTDAFDDAFEDALDDIEMLDAFDSLGETEN